MRRTRLDLSGIETLRIRLAAGIQTALVQTAIAVRDEAQATCPVDTGFLQASIYISSREFSDYDESAALAQARYLAALSSGQTPKGNHVDTTWGTYDIFPDISPDNPEEVWVVVGARHGIVVEYGGVRTAAQPFFFKAVSANRGFLTNQIRAVFGALSVKAQVKKYSTLE